MHLCRGGKLEGLGETQSFDPKEIGRMLKQNVAEYLKNVPGEKTSQNRFLDFVKKEEVMTGWGVIAAKQADYNSSIWQIVYLRQILSTGSLPSFLIVHTVHLHLG